MNKVAGPLPLKIRLLYGSGGAIYATKEAAYTMFILLYYTQVLGLGGSIAGAVIALGLVWDAISDPLVGALSDRLHSRHGRRHPFMFWSILPASVGFIGLFTPPDSLTGSQVGLAAWLLFWSLWVRTFVTTFSIPQLALGAEISHDYEERSQVMALRVASVFIFAVLLPAIGLGLIFSNSGDQDGRFIAENYPVYGLMSAGIVLVIATMTSIGTYRYRGANASGNSSFQGATPKTLLRDLLGTLENRNFRFIIGYDIMAMISYGVVSGMNMLVWTYYWEFTPAEASFLLAAPSLLGVGLVLLLLKPLSKRFSKQQLVRYSLYLMILDALWLYPMKLAGWLPDNGHPLLLVLNFILMLIFMGCFMMRAVNSASLVADISSEHEHASGRAQEGGFFSAVNFSSKLASVTGPVYIGISLDLVGLQKGMLPGQTPEEVLVGLVIAFGLGTLLPLAAALHFIGKVTISREKMAEIQAQLQANSGS